MVRRNQEILGNKIGDLAISPLNGKLLGHRSIKSYNGVRTFAAEDEKSE